VDFFSTTLWTTSGGTLDRVQKGRASTVAERIEVNFEGGAESFSSPFAMDRSSFETATLAHNEYKCPACGEEKAYDKEDPFFRDTA